MARVGCGVRSERGATIAFVAVSMVALLSAMALAIDLGMLMKARTDAQRVADAAALAGASAYRDAQGPTLQDQISGRAFDYASRNNVLQTAVDVSNQAGPTSSGTDFVWTSTEATVTMMPVTSRVRVTVRRPVIDTWFARMFGVNAMPVSATAVAEASNAGGATCVKPFALADAWDEATSDDNPANNVWEEGEEWSYDPDSDYYKPWQGDPDTYGNGVETGYGSAFRDGQPPGVIADRGRPLVIKPQDPQNDFMITPGNFFAWEMPDDPNLPNCAQGGVGANGGAVQFANSICGCNNSVVTVNTPYDVKPGDMRGPTRNGMKALIDLDPGAHWDDVQKTVISPLYPNTTENPTNGLNSPRVIKIALYDPEELYKSGRIEINFTNIGLFFVEDFQNKDVAAIGRFITYAPGVGAPSAGPLARVLRLVE